MRFSDCWRRARLWWHMWLRDLSRAEAEDLMDGLDWSDYLIHLPPVRLRRLRWPRRRPSAADLDRLDADFRAGGKVRDAVVRGLARDLSAGRQGGAP